MSNNKAAEKSNNVVTMKDGRQVDFGVRGKLKKNIEIVGEGVSRLIKLTIDVVNGDTHVLEFNADHPLFF